MNNRILSYDNITSLDPLSLDSALRELPELNRNVDTTTIRKIAHAGIRALQLHPPTGIEEGLACLRDLDFLASSLDRHGVNPFEQVDGLEDAMIHAGDVASSVPRSTITTYAATNPTDERRRKFTDTPEEDIFLDSLKYSFDALDLSLMSLARLRLTQGRMDFDKITSSLEAANQGVRTLIDSMVSVKRTISPECFTNTLRPYFDPLTIGNVSYAAAGGGQLQLSAIEKILYGSEDGTTSSHKFYDENYPYLNAFQRKDIDKYERYNHKESVLSALRNGTVSAEYVVPVATLLENVTRSIRKFRYPHKKAADDNFKLRPDGSVGSGSYTPEILKDLIDETELHLRDIKEIA